MLTEGSLPLGMPSSHSATSTFPRFCSFCLCHNVPTCHQTITAPTKPTPHPHSDLECDTSSGSEEGKIHPENPKSSLQPLQREGSLWEFLLPARAWEDSTEKHSGRTVLTLLHTHPRQINEYFNKEIFH